MRLRNNMRIRAFMMSTVVMAVSAMTWVVGQQTERVPIDADDIGGTVMSARGPEAGVWVVAETTELPTKFARIVVTDDRGRYVLPDLPRATYQVFVRGYGLVDLPRVSAKTGRQLNLKATIAPDAMTAALVYPAAWWLAMVKPPVGLEAQKKFAMDTK